MKYNIKVGEKYLIGENMHETLKGTITGDITAVYSRNVGEMSAYDFCETADEASCFDPVTACDYIRGIMERQNYGFYIGDIKVFDAEHEETVVHCRNEENAKIIARILDMDEKDTFLTEESIWGRDVPLGRRMTDTESMGMLFDDPPDVHNLKATFGQKVTPLRSGLIWQAD